MPDGSFRALVGGSWWRAFRDGARWRVEWLDDDVVERSPETALMRALCVAVGGLTPPPAGETVTLSKRDARRLIAAVDVALARPAQGRVVTIGDDGVVAVSSRPHGAGERATGVPAPPAGLASLGETRAATTRSRERAVLPQRPPRPRKREAPPRDAPATVRAARRGAVEYRAGVEPAPTRR